MESFITLRAESDLIKLSKTFFVTALLLESLPVLPIIDPFFKAQIHPFAAYIFTTSTFMLATVGKTSVSKRRFGVCVLV